MKKIEYNAVVINRIEVAPGLAKFHIAPIGWELSPFEPGQFVAIGLFGSAERYTFSDPEVKPSDPEKIIRRAYSIASGSKENEYLELYVSIVKNGALTPRLFALKPGDKLYMNNKITGMFTIDEVPKDQNIVLIATGTGVAPYMSMLRSNTINNETRKYAVIHGAYNSWDLGYRSEIRTIERLSPNFFYFPIISEPDKETIKWTGPVGFVQEIWDSKGIEEKWGHDITPENTHVFLCGHPDMIDGMIVYLEARGFKEHKRKDPGNIHVEKF